MAPRRARCATASGSSSSGGGGGGGRELWGTGERWLLLLLLLLSGVVGDQLRARGRGGVRESGRPNRDEELLSLSSSDLYSS